MSWALIIARLAPALLRALYYTALAAPALLVISSLLSPEARQQAQQTANVVASLTPLVFLAATIGIVGSLISAIREISREAHRS